MFRLCYLFYHLLGRAVAGLRSGADRWYSSVRRRWALGPRRARPAAARGS